jgi:glycosyltransferase involved in cell wall biosynthesis
MELSIVIPTHNQKDRLRLVLCGLEQQSLDQRHFEILVVDDGSDDGTLEMLRETTLPNLSFVRLDENRGRNRARNVGIDVARGDLVVFLDGDALPAPDFLERYMEALFKRGEQVVLCGFQYSLPGLEYFQTPQSGEWGDLELPSVMKDYLVAHREEMVLNEKMVKWGFSTIRERAKEGGYPFPESEDRQRQVWDMLAACPNAAVRWLGFIPHNGAIGRLLLQKAGGFDEEIPFNEGWELAYRLQNFHGATISSVQADSFHLYHYHPFDEEDGSRLEAQVRYRGIEFMAEKHGDQRIRLLYFWYAHLWPDAYIPEEAIVDDLVDFDQKYRELSAEIWREYQLVLKNHPSLSHSYETEENYEKST